MRRDTNLELMEYCHGEAIEKITNTLDFSLFEPLFIWIREKLSDTLGGD